MGKLIKDIDDLLRGRFTASEDLREGRIAVPERTLVTGGVLLGAIYGIFMGLYGTLRPKNPTFLQLLATTAKLPLLFFLTLAVTFPSLYVISAMAGSRLNGRDTFRLLLAAVAVDLALLASFGPITGFFTLSTESYPFMVVLNVLFFATAGAAGLLFLRRALDKVLESPGPKVPQPNLGAKPPSGDAPPSVSGSPDPESDVRSSAQPPASHESRTHPRPSPREDSPARARLIFRLWMVIFGVVGAQMGWILRPFIGDPERPFELFRERDSNFFQAFFRVLGDLFR
jgi:hypothetical protein